MLEEEAVSPWLSPAFPVPKKEPGTWRLVIDYRVVNEAIITDAYPTPLIEEILIRQGQFKIWSVLDIEPELKLENNFVDPAADTQNFICMINRKRSIRDARPPPSISYPSPPMILGRETPVEVEQKEGQGSEESDIGEPPKKDRALTCFEGVPGYPVSHVVLPNLDLGGLGSFRSLETNFHLSLDHTPRTYRGLKKCKKISRVSKKIYNSSTVKGQ
jgi:hypothetical protein